MTKKKVNVYVHFDNKKYTFKEKTCAKLELFLMLAELKLENDFQNSNLDKSQLKAKLNEIDFLIKKLEEFKNNEKF